MKPPGCPADGRGDHSLLLKTKSGLGRPWVSGGLPVGTKLLRSSQRQCLVGSPAGGIRPLACSLPLGALCLYPSDAFHLHLRLHLNKGSVAENSWKSTGFLYHFAFANELTQKN